ncbi:hypothetical protein [Streptomyces sp. NPDC017529]|uniref:hypothetical protein n=1 Tax=Streptomyces sp. NPDC017529 TaxID=3365000 RepID=UPI003798599D
MNTITTVEQRADLVQDRLLPLANQLAMLVHGDGGQRDVHQLLARLSSYEKDALLVVLAGLVDVDQPNSAHLAWMTFDENGNPVRPTVVDGRTLRELAEEAEDEPLEDDYIDEAAVQQYLAGKPVRVTDAERIAAVARAVQRGMTYLDLDAMHGLAPNNTSRFVSRARGRAAEQGTAFPVPELSSAAAMLSEEQVLEIRSRAATGAETDQDISLSYGVSRQTISAIASGTSYRQYGGPIRPKKTAKPSAKQRVEFAGGTPAVAQAS